MKRLIILALATSLAGCHNRNDEQVGAAPDQGDTTAVTHQIDPDRTGPPGVGGRSGKTAVNLDSLGLDSATVRTDSAVNSPTSTPQDTLGPRTPDSSAVGAGWSDSSTGTWSDSAARDTSSMR